MKHLIITAHPSSTSFTHAVAQTYAEAVDGEVEILDLYQTEYRQDFLVYEDIRDVPEDPSRQPLQDKISWADELVFVYPTWWGTLPAIMKNFIDMNFTSGFAFRFVEGKSQPEKLLTGKTAKVFTTCDAPKFFYWLMGMPAKRLLNTGTLAFCGVKMTDYVMFDGFRKADSAQRAKMLDRVRKLAAG